MLKTVLLNLFTLVLGYSLLGQTKAEEEFQNKLTEIYINATDQKKTLSLAKDLYNQVERRKEWQTYTNYYLLKSIFENQAPDKALAKACEEKGQKKMNELVGTQTMMKVDTSTPEMAWSTYYFIRLFQNDDPEIATKALNFLTKHPSLQTFSNFMYTGYAFERANDFKKAKETYEKALSRVGDERREYHSYLYYTNFLTRTGEYLKADEFIRRMEVLSEEAIEYFRTGYKAEAMSARVIYYLNVGDYRSYVEASEKNYEYFSSLWKKDNSNPCDPYPGIRFTNAAFGKEIMRDYGTAEKLWKSRDSVNYIWVNCYNSTYPNAKYFPISMYPVFLLKRGKKNALPRPVAFYIKETEDHYNSYKKYADLGTEFARATQLGFLGSPNYAALLKTVMDKVKKNHDFRESTLPFANYAYFSMRDRNFSQSAAAYSEMFGLNLDWINDIVFTFGEKAFVTYYNSKLKEGYENFHSFVKITKDKQPALFPQIASQAYDNLLFTKSISLKGTQKRKEAFLNNNDATIGRLYERWLEKKQQLIRQYMRNDNPAEVDTTHLINESVLNNLQDEVNRLENELTQKAKDFKKLLKIEPPGWKDVRDQLKEGEAAVEMVRFLWRDQVYYSDTSYYAAYIITKNSVAPDVIYIPVPARELDSKHYQQYKSNIRNKIDDKDSYNRYWKSIHEKLAGIQKVYFSPDGIYHLINIATLKNPSTQKFVLDEIEIHSTTSTGDIAFTSITPKGISTAVLIGRPAYKTSAKPGTTTAPELATRSFVNNFRENNISDLPGTEEEVMTIKKEMEMGRVSVKYYLKEQATEDKMYDLHSPGVLHIATHGYWSGAGDDATEGYRVFNAMVNSGLLLAGVVNYYSSKEYPDTYDGILTAYEAQNLDLQNTSLVILSACETTLGYLDAGEGVYGLQRAFRAAGAGSIMTSLWKVDDNATRDFMIFFYQEFLRTRDKATAFLFAQKKTREKYVHPYFWGAFVMVGE